MGWKVSFFLYPIFVQFTLKSYTITRKLEGRIEAVEEQLQRQNQLLERIAGFLRKKREA